MTAVAAAVENPSDLPFEETVMAPAVPPSPLRLALRRLWGGGLFGTPLNSVITLAYLGFIAVVVWPFLDWALVKAVWTGNGDACRQEVGQGACWAFVADKIRFILFGLYPGPEQGRSAAALLVMAGLIVATGIPALWRWPLLVAWGVGMAVVVILLGGGFGLAPVATDVWGGMTLSLLVFVAGVLMAAPLAVALALARRSKMGGLRLLSVLGIEITRGIPFIAVLYAATLLFPLMLPAGAAVDKLLRAQIAVSIFVAAFLAETLRAGLQAVPKGQYEAAYALGLSRWQTLRRIILPQAIRTVIPGIVNILLNVFQDTSLVLVIGLFDFLNAARVAANDTEWMGRHDEAYAFAALVYFTLCFFGSRYSLWLERHVSPHRRESR
ncbi:amino acid ABC transporter permease [Novispirillum itersonii]|uniref:General L-amino acid transport system permease protein n=1 Tax=Novispirillum itersonii TaxID=189 RepID=A0A7W9ZIT8_NOVIT|nr:amino acid ABC transporter permease [Novispirillum itersonii]MBB6211407.1 general L-amino acid transport system permease protein [Novispirillum itersonii]